MCTEDSPSGLWRTLGKRVGCKPSGVRIPHPPPPDPGTCPGSGVFFAFAAKSPHRRGALLQRIRVFPLVVELEGKNRGTKYEISTTRRGGRWGSFPACVACGVAGVPGAGAHGRAARHRAWLRCPWAAAGPGRASSHMSAHHVPPVLRPPQGRRAWLRCAWAVAGPGRASRRRAERSSRRGRLAGGPPPTRTPSSPARPGT